eukprot:380114_1
MEEKKVRKPEIELSQEDGPSVIALSVLSSYVSYGSRKIQPSASKDNKIKHPLNLYNRHQRLILYNMIAFIWSLLYLIYYLEAIDNIYPSNDNPNTVRTNELYVAYFAMIFFGSLAVIIIKCIELKEWIPRKNKTFIKFIAFIHNMVGLIYLASFFIHIGITWKQSNEICRNKSANDIWFCKTTFISSGFLCIYISWILCCDTIYRNAKNTGSRIQYIVFFISILMYLICIIHYRKEWNIQNLDETTPKDYHNLLTVGEIGWWLLLFSYFFALILDCVTFTYDKKMYYNMLLMFISFSMIIGSILSVNRNIYVFDNKKFYYQGWFLLITFTGFLSYQLHSKNLNRKRRIIGENQSKESIAEEAPRHRHIEGISEDKGKNNHKNDVHPLLRNKGVLSYHNNNKHLKKIKNNAFNVDHKKQRMIIYNLFIFVWSINMLVYFGVLLQYEIRAYYELEISASGIMLILSIFMIFMEWNNKFNSNNNKYNIFYQYGCCFMYWLSSILQISALIFQLTSSNHCLYLNNNN